MSFMKYYQLLIFLYCLEIMQSFFIQQVFVEGDFKISDIVVQGQLGHGNSHVYAVKISGRQLALKQIEIQTDYQYQSFINQISNLKQLSAGNKYLIKYQGYFLTTFNKQHYAQKKFAYIVMQYAEMNLSNLISLKKSQQIHLSFHCIEKIIQILLKGFNELQALNVAHCDIKPENVLVVKNSQEDIDIRICDVGSCKIVDSNSLEELTIYGTLPFLAPELIQLKSKKIISSNPFRSDVFSFGLVILFAITGRKFSSKQRKNISPETYQQIIGEWIKEAEQLVNSQHHIMQVLKQSLQFDEFKRPIFKQLKILFQSYKRKKKLDTQNRLKKLREQEQHKQNQFQSCKTKYHSTNGGRTVTGLGFTKRNRLTNKFSYTALNKIKINKISPNNTSNQHMKTTLSSEFSLDKSKVSNSNNTVDIGPLVYINKINKDTIPYDQLSQDHMYFVLFSPDVKFKSARTVSIMPSCSLDVVYPLGQIIGNSLYLQYQGVETQTVNQNAPMLDFKNIYINVQNSSLNGGYNNLLRSLCPIFLINLSLRLTGSQITINQVYQELERLKNRDIKTLEFSWEQTLLSQQNHMQIFQKISKLPLKDLKVQMNSNYIRYENQARWPLPNSLSTLYLRFQNNFMGVVIYNLMNSLKSQSKLKQLYLNFRNNNLKDTEIKILLKTLQNYPKNSLQKLILNLSMNPVPAQKVKCTFEDLTNNEESYFKLIKSLQIRIQSCQIDEDNFFRIFAGLCNNFLSTPKQESRLKILKIAYDRKLNQHQLLERINETIKEYKLLKINIINYGTDHYMIYVQKKKIIQRNMIRVQTKNKAIFHKQESHNNGQKNLCARIYTNRPSYQNYICLTCIQNRQLSKLQYFCKICIQGCSHKGHNIVRTYESKTCNCPFNYCCKNTSNKIQGQICAEKMGIKYKKKYSCLKCSGNFCQICIKNCKQNHQEWIDFLGSGFYRCQTFLDSNIIDKSINAL